MFSLSALYEGDYTLEESKLSEEKPVTLAKLEAELDELGQPDWLTCLKDYIEMEFDDTFETPCPETAVKAAWASVMQGNLTQFTQQAALRKAFTAILDVLTTDQASATYEAFMGRDVKLKKVLPSAPLVRLATLRILATHCEKRNIPTALTDPLKERITLQDQPFFLPYKNYTFDEMIAQLNRLLSPYQITAQPQSSYWHILVHLLLRFANIADCPHYAFAEARGVDEDEHTVFSPGRFFIEYKLPDATHRQFMRFYEAIPEADVMAYSFNHRLNTTRGLCVKINTITRLLFSDSFKAVVDAHLSNALILENYQLLQRNQVTKIRVIDGMFNQVGQPHNVKIDHSDFAETAILTAFGIKEPLKGARYAPTQRYEDFMTHVDFFLGISVAAAENLVTLINAQYPGAAKLIATDRRHDDLGELAVQQIAIKSLVLIDKKFIAQMSAAMTLIKQQDQDLYETLQLGCGRLYTTQQMADSLAMMSLEFKDTDQRLATSLETLSLFARERKPLAELKGVNFAVNKAIAAHEAGCETVEVLEAFEGRIKDRVQDFQEKLGLR